MGTVYVIQKCAMSLDGYIDDATPERLILSNPEDFDRVDEVRAGCDAILVGAGTVRADNPRLLVRSEERQRRREAAGLPRHPLKATVTRSGNLAPSASFFTAGDGPKVVYCPAAAAPAVSRAVGIAAEVVSLPADPPAPADILRDLAGRGVRRLLVEGGSEVGTLFLTAGAVDELQVSVAPFFVGDPAAPRFVKGGRFPHGPANRMELAGVEQVGDVAVLTFRLKRLV